MTPSTRQSCTTSEVPFVQPVAVELPLELLRLDGGTQGRVATDPTIVSEYAALMSEGVAFPAIRVWHDGQHYWVADGFQRIAAAKLAGRMHLPADILSGTLEDAQWDCFSANSTHGARRTT